MSTRACYRFFEPGPAENHFYPDGCVTVYKHSDGYPEGAAEWIRAALEYAWRLPRFEADEFAAAFVAANKSQITYYERQLREQLEKYPNSKSRGPSVRKTIKSLREQIEEYRHGRYAEYGGGGIRLIPFGGARAHAYFASDTEYLYDIRYPKADVMPARGAKVPELQITAYTTSCRDVSKTTFGENWWVKPFFEGPLSKLAKAKPSDDYDTRTNGEPDFVLNRKSERFPVDDPAKPASVQLLKEAVAAVIRVQKRFEKVNA